MKQIKINLIIFLLAILFGCGDGKGTRSLCKCSIMLEIENHHATRSFVTYITDCGDTVSYSAHHSHTIICKNGTFDIGDYNSHKKPYGKIK